MCEFCVRHGDGRRWYLNAANYAEELLADLRRASYVEDFIPGVLAGAPRWLKAADRLWRLSPNLARLAGSWYSRRMKPVHYGQIVPLEEVGRILDLVGQVIRLPCVCREVRLGRQEGVCYLLGLSPDRLGFADILGRREEAAPFVAGMERLDPSVARAEIAALEDRGMIHTVWTFVAPFTAAICNCDHDGCLAVGFSDRGVRLFFPGEDAARVDAAACTGCGACAGACPFGAVGLRDGGARVDGSRCEGCGLCRRACPAGALRLGPRPGTPPA